MTGVLCEAPHSHTQSPALSLKQTRSSRLLGRGPRTAAAWGERTSRLQRSPALRRPTAPACGKRADVSTMSTEKAAATSGNGRRDEGNPATPVCPGHAALPSL